MIEVGFHVLFYALIAAASPLVLTATFVVIGTERPRANGLAFLTGFSIGGLIACAVGLVIGETAVARLDSHDTIESVVTLLLGVALVAFGLRQRTVTLRPARRRSERLDAMVARLGRVGPGTVLTTGAALGFGGPKRLVLTLLAMATISTADLGPFENLTLVALYLVVEAVLVWVPVGIVLIAGERAAIILARGQSWLTTHAVLLRVWLSLGLGAALIADAVVRLVA